MKKFITSFALLLGIGLLAQNIPNDAAVLSHEEINNASIDIASENTAPVFREREKTFKEEARANKIATRTFSNLEEVNNGYYVITGVFGDGRNLKRNIKKLKKKGFQSGSILNPENGLNYVYLLYDTDWHKAIEACASNFEGTHADDVWILNVKDSRDVVSDNQAPAADQEPSDSIEADNLALEDVTYDMFDKAANKGNDDVIKEKPS